MILPLRSLGTTGLTVTSLGLGLAALGRPGYINLGHAADLDYDYDVAAMEARPRGARRGLGRRGALLRCRPLV